MIRGVFIAAFLTLSACAGGLPSGLNTAIFNSGERSSNILPPQGEAALPIIRGQEYTLRGLKAVAPDGYCNSPTLSQPRDGFAVLLRCDRFDRAAPGDGSDAVITVQVGRAFSKAVGGQEEAFSAILQDPDGRAFLSATGEAETVEDMVISSGTGWVRLQYTDSAERFDNASGPVSRIYFDLGNRLITVSVQGVGARSLEGQEGLDLVAKAAAGFTR